VSLKDAKHPTPEEGRRGSPRGDAAKRSTEGEATSTTNEHERSGTEHLMEEMLGRDNVNAALKRVMQNKGGPGIDGMKVEELPAWLNGNWAAVRASLLDGTYKPAPVMQREIPKSDGGVRKLGIPTVLDRLIQQCALHVLQPRFDPTFSEHSYGFRPGRSAHQALHAAQQYIQAGRRWVVDVDLEQFFDRVNHDMLMGRLAKRIKDKRMLRLIRGYLNAGIMVDGVVMARDNGTPQGGPLSPLLANVLLDDVDRELEKRGHRFVRYADDCNVYVGSERAGERVMEGMRELFEKLKLRINEAKSAVAPVTERKFLGYSFELSAEGEVHFVVAPKALEALKTRVRVLTGRARGWSFVAVVAALTEYLRGWKNYFRLVRSARLASLDGWIRRRLRALQLKLWKTPANIARAMRRAGVPDDVGCRLNAHRRRYWAMALHPAMTKALRNCDFDRLGLQRLAA
jgi:RNA-directed DNA polymerase